MTTKRTKMNAWISRTPVRPRMRQKMVALAYARDITTAKLCREAFAMLIDAMSPEEAAQVDAILEAEKTAEAEAAAIPAGD